jgi:hypothetical protein
MLSSSRRIQKWHKPLGLNKVRANNHGEFHHVRVGRFVSEDCYCIMLYCSTIDGRLSDNSQQI